MSIQTSETIKFISTALLLVQGTLDGVGRTSENSAFKRGGKVLRYANLEAVIDTAKPALQAAGVVFLQSGGAIVENVMAMTTRLIHAESGEWIEGTMDIALGKHDPQGVGSALTYAQRYHLMAMLGLPPVDDDGETAIDRENKRPVESIGKPVQGDLPKPMTGMKDTAQRALWGRLVSATRLTKTIAEFDALWAHPASKAAYEGFSKDWQAELDAEMRDHSAELLEKASKADPFANLEPNDISLTQEQKLAATP